jgi:Bacteriophage replication gene A protein (GPA).
MLVVKRMTEEIDTHGTYVVLKPPQQVNIDHDLDFMNTFGQYRLTRIREYFGLHPVSSDLEDITRLYVNWRDQPEYIPMRFVYRDKEIIDPADFGSNVEKYRNWLFEHTGSEPYTYKDLIVFNSERSEWNFIKSCKRGNDVYIREIQSRFENAFLGKPILTFFEPDWAIKKTNLLYITGNTDPSKVDHDHGCAWLNFGKQWNNYITQIRNYFRKKKPNCRVYALRTWQSHKNGFPHFHALLYFENYEFSVVTWKHPDGSVSYRLPSRSKDRAKLKGSWGWGNADVICVGNSHDAFTDLLKYITRDLEGGESDLTNSLVWYFRRQSFGISKGFTEAIWGKTESIELAEPTDADLIDRVWGNSNEDLLRIEVLPILPASFLKISGHSHYFIGKPPPTCPDLIWFLSINGYSLSDSPTSYTDDNIPIYVWTKKD